MTTPLLPSVESRAEALAASLADTGRTDDAETVRDLLARLTELGRYRTYLIQNADLLASQVAPV
jgi:hypothetical protein